MSKTVSHVLGISKCDIAVSFTKSYLTHPEIMKSFVCHRLDRFMKLNQLQKTVNKATFLYCKNVFFRSIRKIAIG